MQLEPDDFQHKHWLDAELRYAIQDSFGAFSVKKIPLLIDRLIKVVVNVRQYFLTGHQCSTFLYNYEIVQQFTRWRLKNPNGLRRPLCWCAVFSVLKINFNEICSPNSSATIKDFENDAETFAIVFDIESTIGVV